MKFPAQLEVSLHIRTEAGTIPVPVRWPDDHEWLERSQRRKVVIRRTGRGNSQTEIPSEEADAELYEKIRLPGAPDLDPIVASSIIQELERVDITETALAGGAEVSVEMEVAKGIKTLHELRIPTTKQVMLYRRGIAKIIERGRGVQEIRFNMQESAALYDACLANVSGYEDPKRVPIVHKDAVAREVVDFLENEAEQPGNF